MNAATYIRPNSIRDAIAAAQQHAGRFRFLAGGTDVLVNRFQGNETSSCLVDLTGIDELKTVTAGGSHMEIGALVTLDMLSGHPDVNRLFPALAEAALAAASPVLRKTATVGGNILCENRCSFYNQGDWWREAVGYCLKCDGDVCIATGGTKRCFSRFISDTAPVLIALGASVRFADETGQQETPLEKVYSGDGLTPRNLGELSVVLQIRIPLEAPPRCVFMKLRPRRSMDFTSLTTAVSLSERGMLRIVIGGVDPGPIVIDGPAAQKEELLSRAVKKPRIVDNDVYSRPYRKEMIGVYLRRSFEQLDL
jgi:4-hydroxybenzoyl-CoA reductase subunit beta